MDDKLKEATTLDLLKSIPRDAWAEVTDPNGWSRHVNIGHLAQRASNEIERLQKRIKQLEQERRKSEKI